MMTMNEEGLKRLIDHLLEISPIITAGTQLVLYQPYSLVPYGNNALVPYTQQAVVRAEYIDEVEERKKRIEQMLRKGVRFNYTEIKEPGERVQDPEGISWLVQEMYTDFDEAVESGEYDEIEMCAEGLLGMMRGTIDPRRIDLLTEGVERIRKGYSAYITHAEQEEYTARKKGNDELADYFLETIDQAEEQIRELQNLLKE